jgi:hypothetical protein
MVGRIWLHIGAEKTGTTSIQVSLRLNRQRLADQGVLFAASPGDQNHIALAAYALADSHGVEELRILSGVHDPRQIPSFRERLTDALDREITENKPNIVVFSSEHCSSRLNTVAEIEELRRLLCRYTADVRVILYIRDPVEFLGSWYSTAVASGISESFPWPLTKGLIRAADWLTMSRNWSSVFGTQAVTLRLMDRRYLLQGDLLNDFYSVCLIDGSAFERPPIENESLGLRPLLFLREMNKQISDIVDGKMNPDRHGLADSLRLYKDNDKFKIPNGKAAEIREIYRESHEILRQTYFPDIPRPLFRQTVSAPENEVPEKSLTVDDAVDISVFLWRRFKEVVRR